jgi:hypothetical protein
MRTLREIGPLAVVVAVVAGVTWIWLRDGSTLGTWVLAGLLAGHGLIHLMFLAPVPPRAATATGEAPAWPFDLGRSWLVSRVGAGPVMTSGRILVVVVVGCSILAALATVGILVPSSLWTGLVIATAGSSLLLLGMAFSPNLSLGVAIDVALLWLALWSSWSPAT